MAKKRFVSTKFWDDPYISALNPSEKLLFLYFLTNPLTDICGIYEISLERVSFDSGLPIKIILETLKKFTVNNKIFYIDGFIITRNSPKYYGDSPKIAEGVKRSLSTIPSKILAKIKQKDIQYPYCIDTVGIESELLSPTPTPTPKGSEQSSASKINPIYEIATYYQSLTGKVGKANRYFRDASELMELVKQTPDCATPEKALKEVLSRIEIAKWHYGQIKITDWGLGKVVENWDKILKEWYPAKKSNNALYEQPER